MANSIILIGIGGVGKGVCNHIKYECQRQFGSLRQANTFLLSMDGPADDPLYYLPGGFQIDTNAASKEFYQFSDKYNPESDIESISQGNVDSEMARWLKPKDANNALRGGQIKPSAGFGGQRVPGHAYSHKDISNITTKLSSWIQEATQDVGNKDICVIFLVGSQIGGTGSGLLWDIGGILKNKIGYDPRSRPWLINIYPLPEAFLKTTDKPFFLSAKGFSGLQNLLRLQIADINSPTIITYTNAIKNRYGKIIDVPILVDGQNDLLYYSVKPQDGIIPIVSNFIFSYIQDLNTERITQPDLIDYSNQCGLQPRGENFASMGVYSITYPWKEILNTFKYRFTVNFYEKIFEDKEIHAEEGKKEAIKFLQTKTFLSMFLYDKIQIWKQNNLIGIYKYYKFGDANDDTTPEFFDIDEIKTRSFGFKRKADDFVNDLNDQSKNFYDKVQFFLENQYRHINDSLVNSLQMKIIDFFYTKDRENKLVPLNLREAPHSIILFESFLQFVKDRANQFHELLQDEYNKNVHIANKLLKETDKKLADGLPNKCTEAEMNEFRENVKLKLSIQAWDGALKSMITLSNNIRTHISELYDCIGYSADGWLTIMSTYHDKMLKEWYRQTSFRAEREKWLGRRYVPKPFSQGGGLSEKKFYNDIAPSHLESMMGSIWWDIAYTPQYPSQSKFLLTVPIVPGYNPQSVNELYKDVIKDDWLQKTEYYSFEHHIKYAEVNLINEIKNKNIWEMLLLDFNHGYMKSSSKTITNEMKNEEYYINKLTNELLNFSNVGINADSFSGSSEKRVTRNYYFSPFSYIGKSSFAEKFHARIQSITSREPNWRIVDTSNIHEIRIKKVLIGVAPNNTNSYKQGMADYLKYLKDTTAYPLDIYSNEQNAEKLRRIVVQFIDRDFMRVFIPEVVHLLTDSVETYNDGKIKKETEVFETFSLFYLTEQLFLNEFIESKNKSKPPIIRLKIKLQGIDNDFRLGESWNLPEIVNNVMKIDYKISNTWQENPIRAKIIELWEKFEDEEEQKGKESFKQFLESLKQKALEGKIRLDNKPSDKDYNFPIDDLLLAMRAAVINFTTNALRYYQ